MTSAVLAPLPACGTQLPRVGAPPLIEPDTAGRRYPERVRKGLTEDCRGLVALRHIDEIARQQPMPVEDGFVARQAALILDAALDVIEHDLRQPPLRHAVQVFNVDGLIHSHRTGFPL